MWILALLLLTAMTATNLFSVSSFGEFEFWFAGIKVAAIVAFLLIGSIYVVGLWPDKDLDFSNLTAHGGFFPTASARGDGRRGDGDLLDGRRRGRHHRGRRIAGTLSMRSRRPPTR